MKTKYIITTAQTGSEWDCVEFLLVEATPRLINFLKQTIAECKKLTFDSVSIYADNAGFYLGMDELPEDAQVEEDQVKLVELDSDFVNTLDQPEQQIRYGEMKFGNDQITFTGTGKYTDEEFWGYVPYDFIDGINTHEL